MIQFIIDLVKTLDICFFYSQGKYKLWYSLQFTGCISGLTIRSAGQPLIEVVTQHKKIHFRQDKQPAGSNIYLHLQAFVHGVAHYKKDILEILKIEYRILIVCKRFSF